MEVLTNLDWKRITKYIPYDTIQAIDFETNGTDASHPDFKLFGVGVANADRAFYIDFRNLSPTEVYDVINHLDKCKLIAHNMLFDAACMYSVLHRLPNHMEGCTLVLFKMLAAEGWLGQTWGLGTAIDDILGWDTNNKDTLDHLLSNHRLSKSEMWKLADLEPLEFGRYCGMDADACYQLWNILTGYCVNDLLPILRWHQSPFMEEVKLLIEQQFRGIAINEPKLRTYLAKLNIQTKRLLTEFLTHSQVNPYVSKFNKQIIDEHKAKEPPKLTKTGKVSVRWEAWKTKLTEMSRTNHFNVNSKQQLIDLFYGHMYYSYRGADGKWNIKVNNDIIEVEPTDSGDRSIDKNVLPRLGRPGQLLAEYNKVLKEIQYVESCLEKIRNGVIHPQFKMHGTVTGRLGGDGGFNIQQQPKTRGYLECWTARPGYALVQLDFSAIEPVVLTNASKDPTLMKLYGKNAKPNDVYLYNAAHMKVFADKILKVYDPHNPTPESIAAAKKEFKALRGISKTIHLAKQYGAGVGKIYYTLVEQGFKITWEETKSLCDDWNKLYQGTEAFGEQLEREWHDKGGYIHNITHRPLTVDRDKLKDLVNRYCQSSGHDILLLFLYMRRSMRIPQANLNWFDSTAVPHYQAMFRSGAKHWMVIMFYERVILLLVLVVFVLITRFDSNSSEGM